MFSVVRLIGLTLFAESYWHSGSCSCSFIDLLKSRLKRVHDIYQLSFGFAEVFRIFGFRRSLLIQFGDMLVDLLCATASVEPVRLDLELVDAVQHCRDLVAFHVPN